MAFWIKKKNEESPETDKDNSAASQNKKKKEEKKGTPPKRLDNLRIPQQLKIVLRSVGAPNEYPFLTKDLSATGAFVLCPNFRRYPFQHTSTILDAVVELRSPDSSEINRLQFLAKIARVVEAHGEGASQISGFGIRIIQISMDQRNLLESFIARNGAPEAGQGLADAVLSDDVADPEEPEPELRDDDEIDSTLSHAG